MVDEIQKILNNRNNEDQIVYEYVKLLLDTAGLRGNPLNRSSAIER